MAALDSGIRAPREWAQLPSSDNLHALRIILRNRDAVQSDCSDSSLWELRADSSRVVRIARGYQIDKRDAGPHQRTRALLVFESGNAELPWRGEVNRINNTVAEHQKS